MFVALGVPRAPILRLQQIRHIVAQVAARHAAVVDWLITMLDRIRQIDLSLVVFSGCARPTEPASPSEGEYGYGSVDDPSAEAQAAEAQLPTSCAKVRCPAPRVCRLLSLTDPGGDARAHCLGPDDDLCKIDPEICTEDICRTEPALCQ